MRLLGYVVGALGVLGLAFLLICTSTLIYFVWNDGYWFEWMRLAGWNLEIQLKRATFPGGDMLIAFPWWLPACIAVLLGCAWTLLSIDERPGGNREA